MGAAAGGKRILEILFLQAEQLVWTETRVVDNLLLHPLQCCRCFLVVVVVAVTEGWECCVNYWWFGIQLIPYGIIGK